MNEPVSPYKGKTGLQRVLNAAGYSWAGLTAAFRHEDAFRQEVFLALLLIPLALYLGDTGITRALMIGAVLLVLNENGAYRLATEADLPQSIGRMSANMGNAGVLRRA